MEGVLPVRSSVPKFFPGTPDPHLQGLSSKTAESPGLRQSCPPDKPWREMLLLALTRAFFGLSLKANRPTGRFVLVLVAILLSGSGHCE